MAYVPNNLGIFLAAYSGALAGMSVSDRYPTNPSAITANNVNIAKVAGAFATQFDTRWGMRATSSYDVDQVESLCQDVWESRGPSTNPTLLLPATYATLVNALIALITAGENYLAVQAIVPPSTQPNYIQNSNAAPLGPGSPLQFDSVPITRRKSGIMFTTGEMLGTQSLQDVVTAVFYRDFGLAGVVQLDTFKVAPGGIGSFDWAGHAHAIDILPDGLPHVYTIIATGAGGSSLSIPIDAAEIIVFEMGAPG